MEYNYARGTFPARLFANIFGFSRASLFSMEDATDKELPKTAFLICYQSVTSLILLCKIWPAFEYCE